MTIDEFIHGPPYHVIQFLFNNDERIQFENYSEVKTAEKICEQLKSYILIQIQLRTMLYSL